jgi:hypothetical protein
MSLQSLQWRKLPVVTTSTTSSTSDFLNIIYNMLTGSTYFDGSTRTIGSGSAWSGSKAYITGSNTEAVLCYPPFRTELSQSVLFVGKNTTGAASGGTPTMGTNDGSLSTNAIGMGLSKNSGNFTNWTGSTPMGLSSSFTGYTVILSGFNSYANLKITLYESKEAIAVNIGSSATPTTNFFGMFGAIIDPQQTVTSVEAESDNRIYGYYRSHQTAGIPSSFLSNTAVFLDHNAVSGQSKAVCFSPQTSTIITINCTKILQPNFLSSFLSLSSNLVKMPIYYTKFSSPFLFLGTLRDIYIIRNSNNNLIFRDVSSNILGFTVSTSDGSSDNAILLSYT